MSEQEIATRRRVLEQKLAEQRKKGEFRRFQESLRLATWVTNEDLRFIVRPVM